MGFLYSILLGVAIFWVTGKIMNLRGWGLIMNTLFVIAGSVIGKWALNTMDIYTGQGFISSLISGVIGCCIVLFAIKILNK